MGLTMDLFTADLATADLDRLIDAMRATGTTELRLKAGETRVKLRLDAVPPTAGGAWVAPSQPQPAATIPATIPAVSPALGHWQPRGQGDGMGPLAPGAAVMRGEVLGYVRQGEVLWPLAAPETGTLIDTGPAEGTLLGYGDLVLSVLGGQS